MSGYKTTLSPDWSAFPRLLLFYSTLKKKERLIASCMAELDKKKNKKSWLMVVQGNGSDLLHFCEFKVIFV